MPGLEKNRIYRAHIDGYSSEGLGIARIDGQVVFVHGAIRGEICDVLVMKVLKNAAFGKIAALVEPSPARRTPDCPYYGRCGGCDFRHMSYEEELWAKRARVQDALTRIGGAEVTVEEILGAEQPLHYRNKSIYPISPVGEVGFYRARSHQVVHVEHCLIQKPEADALAQAVRDYIARFQVPPYDEATDRGLLRHLYVRTSCAGESLACLLVNGSRLPHEEELVAMLRAAAPKTCGVVLGENTRRGNAILGDRYRTLWGRDYLTDTLCGLELRLSVPSFYQVNHDQAQRLYEKALEYAGLTGRELAVDLYCGAGTITQVLARRARHVIGGIMEGTGSLAKFLPAVIFIVACFIGFATGTSWGTIGIMVPLVCAVFDWYDQSTLLSIGLAASCAGGVCGDHLSPISDTTIMASAGAHCFHLNHVATQIPYGVTVAAVSFVSFIIAGLVQNVVVCMIIAIVLMIGTLLVIKAVTAKKHQGIFQEMAAADKALANK